jgi:hypothetical protein
MLWSRYFLAAPPLYLRLLIGFPLSWQTRQGCAVPSMLGRETHRRLQQNTGIASLMNSFSLDR